MRKTLLVLALVLPALFAAFACSNGSPDRPPLSISAGGSESVCTRAGGVCVPGDRDAAVCGPNFRSAGTSGGCPQETGPAICCLRSAATDASIDVTSDAVADAPTTDGALESGIDTDASDAASE